MIEPPYYLQELFSPPEAAEQLGLTPEYVASLCKSGDINARKVGRQWVISREALDAYKAKPKNGRGKYLRKPVVNHEQIDD